MNKQEAIQQLTTDLKDLMRGHLSEQAFREKYNRSSGLAVLEWIWHGLEHYLADADIRAKDPEYRKMQNQELRRLIQLLEEGGSEKQIRAISFLGRSR